MRGNVRSHRAGTASAEGERVNKRVLLIVANGRWGVGIFYAGRSNMEMSYLATATKALGRALAPKSP